MVNFWVRLLTWSRKVRPLKEIWLVPSELFTHMDTLNIPIFHSKIWSTILLFCSLELKPIKKTKEQFNLMNNTFFILIPSTIISDGSRYSPRWGCQHMILPNVSKKVHEIEIIWTPRGHTPNISLCRSTIYCVNCVEFSFTMLPGFVFLICRYNNWNFFWQKCPICFHKITICEVLVLLH